MAQRILVADDEANIAIALEFLLTSNGYEVQLARDGVEALRLAASGRPDLVLLDVMMPLLSGYEVCRQIRAQPGGEAIKIVMLSAKGREAEVAKGLGMGADLYVMKPFSTRELLEKIRALLAPPVG